VRNSKLISAFKTKLNIWRRRRKEVEEEEM